VIRRATVADIPRLREIRDSVRENRLSDPSRVTLADYQWHVAHAPIHVWDEGGVIKGMAAGDPRDGSIWALFVDPAFEGHGIGRALIAAATNAVAAAGHRVATLSTEPGTRAERFYRLNGWIDQGRTDRGEIVFTMDVMPGAGARRRSE
jgi:GNAT superfamily N-acetyltransferase